MTGEYLKSRRKSKGWSQSHLASLLGVTVRTVANYEGGGKIPESKMERLTMLLGTPLSSVDDFANVRDLVNEDYLDMASKHEDPHKLLTQIILSRLRPVNIISYIEENRHLFQNIMEQTSLLSQNSFREAEIETMKKEIAEIKKKIEG